MAVTRVASGSSTISSATSLAVTMSAAPTAGNLLLAFVYSGNTNSPATMTTPAGWTAWEASSGLAGTTTSVVVIYYRVVQAGDGTSWTFAATGTATFWAIFIGEYSAGATWAAPGDQKGNATGSAAATLTLTAGGPNAQANDFGFAGVGSSGTPGYPPTWTGGFVDSGVVVASRLSTATVETAAVQTTATTATWTTGGTARGALGTFLIPGAGAGAVTVVKRTPANRARFRAANW